VDNVAICGVDEGFVSDLGEDGRLERPEIAGN